jgi:hypothetical protein
LATPTKFELGFDRFFKQLQTPGRQLNIINIS